MKGMTVSNDQRPDVEPSQALSNIQNIGVGGQRSDQDTSLPSVNALLQQIAAKSNSENGIQIGDDGGVPTALGSAKAGQSELRPLGPAIPGQEGLRLLADAGVTTNGESLPGGMLATEYDGTPAASNAQQRNGGAGITA